MPVICPTCQIFSLESPSIARRRFYSNPCTGGAVFAAITGGGAFAAPVSTGLATGNGFTLAAACCWVPASGVAPACVTCRARGGGAECPTPQECAIAGPAVYPINAPATAPTGPRTTAPDTAPKAALPARAWAFASQENNDPAITAATSNFFIAVPLDSARRTLEKCGGTKVTRRQPPFRFKAPDSKSPRRFPARAYRNSCDDADMPVICPTCQIISGGSDS